MIAQASGFVSANIHSSVSGTVSAIDNIIDAAGLSKPAITIQVEGDEWIPEIDRSEKPAHNITLSKEEIVKAIAAAGIVGMGGATFPTQVKLTPPPGNKAEVLIINGVECEPYLTADHARESRRNYYRCTNSDESDRCQTGYYRYREQ